jgi:hypothetical protein
MEDEIALCEESPPSFWLPIFLPPPEGCWQCLKLMQHVLVAIVLMMRSDHLETPAEIAVVGCVFASLKLQIGMLLLPLCIPKLPSQEGKEKRLQ